MEEYAGENAVCILYFGDLNEAYVHVGSGVIPDYDTGRLKELLCAPVEVDEFSQFVSVFDTLSADAGKATGKYATYIERPDEVEEEDVRAAVKPLHEVFPGYVCVDYRSTRYETFTSVLRAFREIDYDEEYALWEHEMDYYYRDAIYITYYGDTGGAFIDIGEDTGIKLSDSEIQQLEAAFKAASDKSDCSGFAAGVTALAEAVAAPAGSGGENGVVVIAAAAAVVLLAGVVLVKVKKRT